MKKKGFTLLELMIAVSIFILFSGFLYKVYFDEIKSLTSIGNRSTQRYNAKTAVGVIDRQMRDNINFTVQQNNGKYTKIISDGIVLVDITGTASGSNIYFDNNIHALCDKNGNILCRDVQAINMDLTNNFLQVEMVLGSSENGLTVKTGYYLR